MSHHKKRDEIKKKENEELKRKEKEEQEKRADFGKRLKEHLSNEYIRLNDKKMNIETESIQIKMEMDQKDKSLFPGMNKKDYRKYFSPLNIAEEEQDKKNEIDEKYHKQMSRINSEIEKIDDTMNEIKDFLREIDTILM